MIGLAVLGCAHSHTPGKAAAIRANDRVRLLGAYDADGSVREARSATAPFENIPWFPSAEALLMIDGLDAVVIDGYAHQNHRLACAALEAGKSILLEKPAGTEPGQLERLQSLAAASNLYIQMGYQFRYMPAFEFTRRAVADGLLGDVFSFRARISKAQAVYEQLLPELSRYPGGNFYELGCHVLDMAIALMGSPRAVQRVLRTDYGQDTVFADNTVAVLEFDGGIAVLESSAMEVDPKRRIEVYGTKGTIIMQPIMPTAIDLCLAESHTPYIAGWQTVDVGDRPMFQRDIEEFVAVLLGEKAPDYGPEHTLVTQNTLLDICQTAQNTGITDQER